LPHEAIKEGDHRAQGAARLYKQIAPNPFLLPFYERYAQSLRLPLSRDFLTEKKPLGSPLGGASEPLIRGYVPVQDLNLLRKGEAGETKTVQSVKHEFEEFWNLYPTRNGKKLEKKAALKNFCQLTTEDRQQVIRAVKNYAASGEMPKDPHRWLRTGKGDEPWRDWLEPAHAYTNGHGQALICTKRIQGPGDRFRPCGQSASPECRPTEPRCSQHLSEATRSKELTHAAH
jgi:hypothetical protein